MQNKLWCILGKCNQTSIPGIFSGGDTVTSQVDIANKFAAHFNSVCSSDSYNPAFKCLKDKAEALLLMFSSWLAEPYNDLFSMDELLAALDSCRNMSPGPDGIHNEMLTHLPPLGKDFYCLCITVYG